MKQLCITDFKSVPTQRSMRIIGNQHIKNLFTHETTMYLGINPGLHKGA